MQLATKTFIVTGAGSGIGRELALQLLDKGANVAAVDINPTGLEQTEQLAKVGRDRLKGFTLDITHKESVDAFLDRVVAHFGVVDGLINNAGIIQPFKPVADLTSAEIERVMGVNFWGTLYLTKAFLPHFLARPEAHIANISSIGGFLPVPGQTIYGAAKAAVKLLTEGLYAELMDTRVRVTVVFPGAIATNISENSGLGKPNVKAAGDSGLKPLAPSRAAEQILIGIERNQFRVMIGRDARLMDLFCRLSPRRATRFIRQKMKALRQS